MLLNQDQDLLADLSIAICSSLTFSGEGHLKKHPVCQSVPMSPDVVVIIFTSNSGWRLHEEVNAGSALPEHFYHSSVEDGLAIEDEMTIKDGVTIEYRETCLTIDEN